MRSLSQTFIWSHLNKGGAISNQQQRFMSSGIVVNPSDMPTTMLTWKNRVRSVLMSRIKESMEIGEIILMRASDVKMPTYLPFFLVQQSPNRVVGVVVLNNIIENATPDEIFVDVKKFKVYTDACFLALKMHQMGNSPKLKSASIIRAGSKIHAGVISECLNRKYSIKLDLDVYNAVLYLDSIFFMKNVLNISHFDQETYDNYAMYNCKSANISSLRQVSGAMEESDFVDISTFLTKISQIDQLKHRLGKLTTGDFLSSYITMYDTSMLLAMECFNYLLFNIIAVNDGTFINNQLALKNIIADDGKNLYADLVVTVQ